jgi:hypothetical protein
MCPDTVRWLYRLDSNYEWQCPRLFDADYVFYDRDGSVRLILQRDGRITVTRGYAWNGCSPKFCLFDIVLGPPEGAVHAESEKPKTYYASLLHDALYQFLADGLPLSRTEADRYFLILLRRWNFRPAWIYWFAVRVFGRLLHVGKQQSRHWRGERWIPADDASLAGARSAKAS